MRPPPSRHCVTCGIEFCPVPSKGAWRVRHCTVDCRRAFAKNSADIRHGSRTRLCEGCGSEFTFFIARGKERKFCSDPACHRQRMLVINSAKPLCIVEGCDNPRGYASGICNSCYYRQKRTGTLARRQYLYRGKHSSGYIALRVQSHPLATPEGFLLEHRKVLYDAIGPGTHPCHWCSDPVEWMKKGTARKCTLVVDHLDGDKANNAKANLVPACSRCNWSRGLMMSWVSKHKDDPILWRMYESARERPTLQEAHAQTSREQHLSAQPSADGTAFGAEPGGL